MTGLDAPVVYVVDDDEAMRNAIQWLLQSVHLASSVYAGAQAFLDDYSPGQPGCLLLDVRMPGMSGLDLLDRLQAENMDIPAIVMSAYADVPMAVRALKHGALDFIQKPYHSQTLLDAVQSALRLDGERRAKRSEELELQQRLEKLTQREKEVLEYIKGGKPSRLIAHELGISPKTVDVHRAHIMRKLNIHHVVELGGNYQPQLHLELGAA